MPSPAGPTVSILVPCFDAEPWIARALDSALAQTYPVAEILVLDDGSRDGTRGVLAGFAGRVTVLHGPHCGAAGARNALLRRTSSEWLQYLDADDEIDPDKIERQVALAAREPADIVAAPVRLRDGRVLHASVAGDPWIDLMHVALGITSANLWRREAVAAAGAWAEGTPCCQEYDLLLRMLRRGARVARDGVAGTVWGTENPRSLSRKDEEARDLQVARIVREAALDPAGGGGDPRRRATAAIRLLDLARHQWRRGHPSWREVAGFAEEIEPEAWRLLPESHRVYSKVYRALGFAWAQRYDAFAARLRRAPGGAPRRA